MPLPRLELKFRVAEATAIAVREYVSAFLELDRFVSDRASFSYPVDSIYLDSDGLTTFWNTLNGRKCRFKLRARTYGESPDGPVFLEIKSRVHPYIIKHRAAVRRESVDDLLSGLMPAPGDMAAPEPDHLLAAEKFVQLMQEISATPRAHVRYQREAWIDPLRPGVRLTFDRDVQVRPAFAAHFRAGSALPAGEPAQPFGRTVILEMKFSGETPHWFRDVQQIGELQQTSAAKYCDGVLMRGIEEFTPGVALPVSRESHEAMELRRPVSDLASSGVAMPSFA